MPTDARTHTHTQTYTCSSLFAPRSCIIVTDDWYSVKFFFSFSLTLSASVAAAVTAPRDPLSNSIWVHLRDSRYTVQSTPVAIIANSSCKSESRSKYFHLNRLQKVFSFSFCPSFAVGHWRCDQMSCKWSPRLTSVSFLSQISIYESHPLIWSE